MLFFLRVLLKSSLFLSVVVVVVKRLLLLLFPEYEHKDRIIVARVVVCVGVIIFSNTVCVCVTESVRLVMEKE